MEENNDQIENEDIGSPMKDPFDPSKIKIRSQIITIDAIIERIKRNEIDLNTKFQRKEGLWNDEQQSRLIESILIRFPLPVFYFDGSDPDNWLVIDGLQRLSSLKRFIFTKELKLTKLEFLRLEGISWDMLERPQQRQINETQLQCYVLEEGTEEDVKFNVFKRINTGGLILSAQEIRHAMHQGIAADFVKELADSNEFKKATHKKVSSDRMLDRDFVNRFLAFYLNDYEKDYSNNDDLDSFMNKTLTKLAKTSTKERETIESNFKESLLLAHLIFGTSTFCKAEKYKRINKALFEIISVSFAKLSGDERLMIKTKRTEFKKTFYHSIKSDFKDSLTSNTGGKYNIVLRHSRFQKIVNQILLKS